MLLAAVGGACVRRDGGVIEIVVGRGAGVSMCDSVLLATGGGECV